MGKIIKVIVWRIISISITLFVFWIATGNIKAATGVALFLHVILVVAHLTFELIWEKVEKRRGVQ